MGMALAIVTGMVVVRVMALGMMMVGKLT